MNDPRNIPLSFDARTLDYLVNVLAQRPYAEAAPVIDNIRQQVAEHNFNLNQPTTGHQEKSPSSGLDGAVGHLNGAGGAGVAGEALAAS